MKSPRPSQPSLPICSALRLLAATCLLALGAAPLHARSDVHGAIAGNVVNATDQSPIEGAHVTLSDGSQATVTDKAGRFFFAALPQGNVTFLVSAEGFKRLRLVGAQVKQGGLVDLGHLPDEPNGPVDAKAPEVTIDVGRKENVTELATLVITGEKVPPFLGTHNVDQPRTINDVQPRYIWNSEEIEASGAIDIQDFFQRMVPMDASSSSNAQVSDQVLGNVSNINLGGLNSSVSGAGYSNGTQNTLLLVDGRRLPSLSYETQTIQPDMNGVPLAAIDHIEVLPASASAIYGGSAAGGVVNIVLRHNYSGVELKTTYENTFSSDAPIRSGTISAGVNLEGGKTNVLMTASWTEQKPMWLQDRMSLVNQYENRYFSLFPGGIAAYAGVASGTVLSSLPFIVSSAGKPLFTGSTATMVQVPAGYAGFTQNGLAPLQANIGNVVLAHPDDATFRGIGGLRYLITQSPIKKGLGINISRQMTKQIEFYLALTDSSNISSAARESFSLSGTTVAANNPNNPFGQAVKVTAVQNSNPVPEVTDRLSRSLGTGLKFYFANDWGADLDYTWGKSSLELFNPSQDNTALASAITAGTANVIADLGKSPIPLSSYYPAAGSVSSFSTMNDVSLRGAGPLMKLWSGRPTLAVGLEHRKEGNGDGFNFTTTPLTPANATMTNYRGQSTDDDAASVELNVPLVSEANKVFGVRSLDLQAAARGDRYETLTTSPASQQTTIRGSTITYSPGGTAPGAIVSGNGDYRSFNEIVGLKYQPVDGVTFRSSYAGGFVPPTYAQLAPPVSSTITNYPTGNPYPGVPLTSVWSYTQIIDPARGNAQYYVPTITGGNPDLKPETSRNFAWGVILEPKMLSGLRISLDYTRVTKHDNIVSPAAQLVISTPAFAANRVTRGAAITGDGFNQGPITLIDASALNAVESISSSYIVQADYLFKTSLGNWKAHGIASFAQHYEVQSTSDTALVEYLSNPDYTAPGLGFGRAKFKGNLGISWSKGAWSAGWLARYTGAYTVGSFYGIGGGSPVEGTVNGWVSGQIYHDVNIGYRSPAFHDAGLLGKVFGNITIQAGVKNVFNHAPPYDAVNGIANFWYSTYGDIRMADYFVTLKKTF